MTNANNNLQEEFFEEKYWQRKINFEEKYLQKNWIFAMYMMRCINYHFFFSSKPC